MVTLNSKIVSLSYLLEMDFGPHKGHWVPTGLCVWKIIPHNVVNTFHRRSNTNHFKKPWNKIAQLQNLTQDLCSLFLSDGSGGFPKDDPGGREDGWWRAAGKNLLLHDVEPPNQHTGHCTGKSRYLKASRQFSSTSADSTHPSPSLPSRVLNIQHCLFMALIPLLFISICHSPLPILFFFVRLIFLKMDAWWFHCLISPSAHVSISVLSTDAKH